MIGVIVFFAVLGYIAGFGTAAILTVAKKADEHANKTIFVVDDPFDGPVEPFDKRV